MSCTRTETARTSASTRWRASCVRHICGHHGGPSRRLPRPTAAGISRRCVPVAPGGRSTPTASTPSSGRSATLPSPHGRRPTRSSPSSVVVYSEYGESSPPRSRTMTACPARCAAWSVLAPPARASVQQGRVECTPPNGSPASPPPTPPTSRSRSLWPVTSLAGTVSQPSRTRRPSSLASSTASRTSRSALRSPRASRPSARSCARQAVAACTTTSGCPTAWLPWRRRCLALHAFVLVFDGELTGWTSEPCCASPSAVATSTGLPPSTATS